MADRMPGWGYYIISGLAGALVISLSITGTLLMMDRTEWTTAVKKIVSVQETQGVILHKLCMLAPLDHKGRVEHLKLFPFTWPSSSVKK